MDRPMMPKATAVWLIDNTKLTFDQIAGFCGLHPLEVQGIADGDVAAGIKGLDPVMGGQITREEIAKGEESTAHVLRMATPRVAMPSQQKRKGPRYTPVSRRQDRPNAIAWLLRHHPELSDAQIGKLVGTTKPTINAIRERTHWNQANLKPADPVTLGLCRQMELDEAIAKAQAKNPEKVIAKVDEEGERLMPVDEALQDPALDPADPFAGSDLAGPAGDPLDKDEAPLPDADALFPDLEPKDDDASAGDQPVEDPFRDQS